MGQPLTQYTTTDAVRSASGLDEVEIPDEWLVSSNIDLEIMVYLRKRLPNHAAVASAGQAASPTDGAVLEWQSLRLAAQWLGVWAVAQRKLQIARSISDGDNSLTRYDIDLDRLAAQAEGTALNYLGNIEGFVPSTGTGGGYLKQVAKATPRHDPVTGRCRS